MTRDEMAGVINRVFAQVQKLRSEGQKEYAREDDNAFANFERVGERVKCPHCGDSIGREATLMVYLEKHIDGIHSYISGHRSQREGVCGRILDSIVYNCLLYGMVEDDTEIKTREIL